MSEASVHEGEKRSFAPVVDAATRVLILGSLPGELSLQRSQYYANPRNQFWRLIGSVTGQDLLGSYDERLIALRAVGVGLWDVVKSARRKGSLDAAIQDHIANPLLELAQTLPALKAVAFNGGKAARIGRAKLGALPSVVLVDLPSSSPAHTMAFERKLASWRRLAAYLGA